MVTVSIVIPVYNAEKYINQALDSLLAQSLTDFEIICVDDCSQDNSYKILEWYQERDARITVIKNEQKSEGAALARNIGISRAAGKYLLVLDADDFFESDMLLKACGRLDETGADIVIFDAYEYDDVLGVDKKNGTILKKQYVPGEDVFSPVEYSNKVFHMLWGAAWNIMCVRSFIEENNICFQSIHHADDLLFCYLAVASAKRVALIKEKLMHYRYNIATSQTSMKSKWPESGYMATYMLKKELIRRGLYDIHKIGIVQRSFDYAVYYLFSMDNVKSFSKLYNDLRNEYFEKLGMFDIPDQEFEDVGRVQLRDTIMKHTVEEFLFLNRGRGNSLAISEICTYASIGKYLMPGTKIAIYGAGNVGKAVFGNLCYKTDIKIVTWVDKRYEELGFPISDPAKLQKQEFDFAIIAVADENICANIKQYLVVLGIKEEQIIWVMEMME